ncbi:Fic family protein [Pedobacter panaciterrae]|uniref:Fic family protein n=1 Tax=Pedobacter panaciterrae TaxID=363849 RepID=UPI0025972628|nr:Fic family protein [uncultured Pedobacter sp.]
MESLLKKYDALVAEYSKVIIDSFNLEDFKEYNEILFSAHSCAVEGNTFTVDETRELKEKGLNLKLNNRSLYEAYEILDHFKAYEFVFNDLKQPLTENLIKQVQRILTENTLKFAKGLEPGEYTNTQMAAGDTVFGDFRVSIARMPSLISSTELAMEKAELHPLDISARFHQFFIYLHPFPDGNGRTGRLISNFILAKFNLPHVIIGAEEKAAYIEALKQSAKHKDTGILTVFFAETSMQRMKNEIDQKKNLTQNFVMNFNPPKKGRKMR